jgi:hypothetical protein
MTNIERKQFLKQYGLENRNLVQDKFRVGELSEQQISFDYPEFIRNNLRNKTDVDFRKEDNTYWDSKVCKAARFGGDVWIEVVQNVYVDSLPNYNFDGGLLYYDVSDKDHRILYEIPFSEIKPQVELLQKIYKRNRDKIIKNFSFLSNKSEIRLRYDDEYFDSGLTMYRVGRKDNDPDGKSLAIKFTPNNRRIIKWED